MVVLIRWQTIRPKNSWTGCPVFCNSFCEEQPAAPILLVDNGALGSSAFVPELRNNQQLENQTPAYQNR